jgi:hypothetical protein
MMHIMTLACLGRCEECIFVSKLYIPDIIHSVAMDIFSNGAP